MNLWVRRAGLIFGLALFIFACDEPGEINLGLNPDQQNYVTGSVEIPIGVSVGLVDSYLISDASTSTGVLLVGKHTDSIFGTKRSEAYVEPWLHEAGISIGNNAQLSSIQLSLVLTDFHGYVKGVSGNQKFTVHELTEKIDDERSLSSDKYEYENNPLVEFDFQLDSLVNSLVLSKDLPLAFGQNILEKMSEIDTVKNNGYIHEFFKGLAFVPDVDNDMMFSINPRLVGTRLRFIYDVNSVADTFHLTFISNISYYIENDFTGTEFEALAPGAPPVETTSRGYLNAFSGIYSELDFSGLLALRDSIGPYVINRAVVTFGNILIDSVNSQPAFIYAFNKRNIKYFELFPLFNPEIRDTVRFGNSFAFPMEAGINNARTIISYPFPPFSWFEEYLQGVLTDHELFNSELKYVLIPSGYGRSFNQLTFNKDKIKFKLYYSYLKSTSSSTTD